MRRQGRKLFTDRSVFSNLVRAVVQEVDGDHRRQALASLRDFITRTENIKTVREQSDSLLLVICEIFQDRCSPDFKLLCCQLAGILIVVCGNDSRRLLLWLFNRLETRTNDEVKSFILTVLLQALQHGGRSAHIEQLLPMIMNHLQSTLEVAETPEMLMTSTNSIHYMAQNYPGIFSSHFKDTVDILVGWHIDVTQQQSLIKYCSGSIRAGAHVRFLWREADESVILPLDGTSVRRRTVPSQKSLVSLRPFWIEDMNFTVHLLSQFVEDLEAYAEDLTAQAGAKPATLEGGEKQLDQGDMPNPELCRDKIVAFLGVFMTVLRSIGNALSTAPAITPAFVSRIFNSIILSAETVQKNFPDSDIYCKANGCISVICDVIQSQLSLVQSNLMKYIQTQLDSVLQSRQNNSSARQSASALYLFQKVCRHCSSGLNADLVKSILGPNSRVRLLRHRNNKQLVHLLLKVYQSLLCVKDVTILEQVYSLILGDLEVAFNALLVSSTKVAVPCSVVSNNPFVASPSVMTAADAELIATFDLAALTEIGRSKSILGVWALSPSIFDLLTSHLLPRSWVMSKTQPAVHYTLLHSLYTHCDSHGHFISSSRGIAIPTGASEPPGGASKTGQYFTQILHLLTDLLPNTTLIADSRRLAIHWLSNIILVLQQGGYYHVFITPQFVSALEALLYLAFDVELDIVIAVCECLQLALPTPNLPITFMERVFSICKTHLASTNPTVVTSYSHLLNHMPCHILSRIDPSPLVRVATTDKTTDAGSSGSESLQLQVLPKARRCHMTKQVKETFLWTDARTVLAFLLLGEQPSDADWLPKIYHNCQRPQSSKAKTDIISEKMIDHNLAVQCFWATWEAAQFCVTYKLRTPIGKPQDTFRAIEGALKEFIADHQGSEETRVTIKAFSREYSCLQLRPLLLLQFMEHLEKLVHNATEGCAVSLPMANKAVKTFFRTNMTTCQDWFSIMRPVLYAVAINCDQYAFAYRQAAEMIRDCVAKGTTAEPRFEDAVRKAAHCSARLGDPQGIAGLQTWCESTAQRKLPWLSVLIKHAERNYESCAIETIQALKEYAGIAESSDLPAILGPKAGKGTTAATIEGAKPDREGGKNGPTIKLMTRESTNGNNNISSLFQVNPTVVSFLANEVVDMYLSVGDYKTAIEWQEAVKHLQTKTPDGVGKSLALSEDFNAIKALGSFQDRDFGRAQEYLNLVPELAALRGSLSGWEIEKHHVYNLSTLGKTAWLLMVESLCQNQILGCATNPIAINNGISCPHPEMSKVLDMFEKARLLQCGGLKLNLLEWPSLTSDLASLSQLTSMMMNTVQTTSPNFLLPLGTELKLHPSEQNLKTLSRAVLLTSYQLHLQRSRGNSALEVEIAIHLNELHLAVASLARKLGNLKMAERFLIDQTVWMSGGGPAQVNPETPTEPPKSLASLLEGGRTKDLTTLASFRLERECCKLFHSGNQRQRAWEQMASVILKYAGLANTPAAFGAPDYIQICELNSRSLCGLVKWLTVDYRTAVPHLKQARGAEATEMGNLARSLKMLLELEHSGSASGLGLGVYIQQVPGSGVGASPAISENDAVCGRLLHLATMQSPSLAKAWASLAAWCYRWGRKAVDLASEEETVNLTAEETTEIGSLLLDGINASHGQEITGILNQANIKSMNVGEEDITEQLQSVQDSGYESMRKKLLTVCAELEQPGNGERVDKLLGIWQRMCHRVYSHYRLAAWAYFTFLQLNGTEKSTPGLSNTNSSNNASSAKERPDRDRDSPGISNQEDHNVTATLRLLRLLVKHASHLKDVLENGLSTTPTGPWKSIIPQLFSRLNHPETYVRQSISDLLCRVAHDSPHLIIYQAVVGCADSESRSDDIQEAQQGVITKMFSADIERGLVHPEEVADPSPTLGEDPSPPPGDLEEEERNQSLHMMENSLQTILSVLSQHNPTMVTMTKLLVKELRRITLLWEELWLGTLNHVQHDLSRRIAQLEDGVQRIQKNDSLSKAEKEAILQEKHKAILKPIVFALEQVELLTSRPAETPNERLFQQNHAGQIKRALAALKQPENLEKPSSCWSLFKQFHNHLNQRANRRAHSFLHLLDISPKLGEIRDSPIPLPGLSCNSAQVVTVSSMSNSINILPTKTKPKKLVFSGSDGKRHTYLFKGLEDLHLDERIMQFLTIVNTMFGKNKKSEASLYHACYYSVTPLGPRSGLIQWVDGAFALYGLYKRWQQREAVSTATIGKGGETMTAQQPMRPSELYFNKITSALKKEGLSVTTPRKDWPLSLQCDVLQELITETPEDLLAKELWCSTGGANEWWYLTQSFSRSTAVMSIIGYIIGLGDRHLDNVLVNFSTGEVVHIDYNVCFEKGKNLRIPERVPFRLTQNVQRALGLTGIEGAFRYSCEEVLKILRKGRETLLTLLEAFVYDPLVDWTTGNEGGFAGAFYGGGHLNPVVADGGERRREMEREATRSLFSSKVAELKGEWFNIRDDLHQALLDLIVGLEEFMGIVSRKEDVTKANVHLTKQLDLLQAALRDKQQKHQLYTLQGRWLEVKQIDGTRSQILGEIEKRVRDGQRFSLQHKLALDTVRGQQLNAVAGYLAKTLDLGKPTYATAAGFLQRAGQGHLVAQYEKLEQELNQAVHQRRKQLNQCMEKLQLYCSVAVKFPENFAEQNRVFVWQGWLQQLLQDMSPEICRRLLQQFQREYSAPSSRQIKEILVKESHLARAATKAKGALKENTMRSKVELQESGGSTRVENLHKQLQKLLQGRGEPLTISPAVLPHIISMLEATFKMDTEMIGQDVALYKHLLSKSGPLMKLQNTLHAAENILSLPPLLAEIQQGSKPLDKILQCIHATNATIDQILLLYSHFEQLWLPEVLELIQEGERTFQSTVGILSDVIKDCPMGLQEMITSLERSIQSDAEPPQITVVEACQYLQNKYQAYLSNFMMATKSHLAPTLGEHLVLDMDGHFRHIRESLERSLLSHEGATEVAEEWVDWGVVREARAVKTTEIRSENQAQVRDLLFLYQVQFLQQVFRAAQQHVASKQKGHHKFIYPMTTTSSSSENGTSTKGKRYNSHARQSANNNNLTAVTEPIKRCLGQITAKMVLGRGTELLTSAGIITAGHVQPEIVPRLPGLATVAAFVAAAREGSGSTVKNNSRSRTELQAAVKELVQAVHSLNRVRHLELELQMYQEIVARAEGRVVMMQWLYEDVLLTERNFQFQYPARTFVMTGIHREYQQLVVLDRSIASTLEKVIGMQGGISQRLKWAAGANPQVSEVLRTVETSLEHKTAIYQQEAKHSAQLTALSSAILHFEAHRTRTSESIKADSAIQDLLKRCDEVARQRSESTARVSDLEVSLVTLRPPSQERPINAKWFRAAIDQVKKKIGDGEKLAEKSGLEVSRGKESLVAKIDPLYTKMSDFHALMSEVKPLLRSLAQEGEEGGTEGSSEVTEMAKAARKFLTDYRNFSENLAGIVKQVMRDKGEEEANRVQALTDLCGKMTAFAEVMSDIFDALVLLAKPLLGTTEVGGGVVSRVEKPATGERLDIPRVEVLLSMGKRGDSGEGEGGSKQDVTTSLTPSNVTTPPANPKSNAGTPPATGLRPTAAPVAKTSPAIMCDPRTGKLIQVRNAHAINVWRRVKGKLDGRDPDPSHRLSVPEQVDFVIKEATSYENLATLYEGWTAWV